MPIDTAPAPVTPAVSSPSPAPAPAPSAAPSPSPASSTPAAPPAADTTTAMDSFDKQFTDLNTPPSDGSHSQPTGETKVDHPIDPKAADPKPADPKSSDDPAAEEFNAPQTGTLIQVRQWGRRMADMARHAQTKARELEGKLQELESKGPQVPPDVQKIQADYQRLQQELADHRQRLTRADYSQSNEYETEFKQPYQEAYSRGRRAAAALSVRVTDPQTGEMSIRPGTVADFDKLYDMTDSDADEAAEKMFGPSARRVIGLRDQAKERAEKAVAAVKENTEKFAQQRQQTQAQMAQQNMAIRGLWTKINTDLQTKHAQVFGEHEGDKEWNEGLAKGREIARQRFSDAYGKMTPEQRVLLDAQIFNRTAAFTPMKARITKLETQLADAQKTIDQLRASGPGKPTPAGDKGSGGTEGDWEREFDKKL